MVLSFWNTGASGTNQPPGTSSASKTDTSVFQNKMAHLKDLRPGNERRLFPLTLAPHQVREEEGAGRSKGFSHQVVAGEGVEQAKSLPGGLAVRNRIPSPKYRLPVYDLKWMPLKWFIWTGEEQLLITNVPSLDFSTGLFTWNQAFKTDQTRLECAHFNIRNCKMLMPFTDIALDPGTPLV